MSTGSEALTAKLHAMHGKSMSPQNYRELIRKQSVSEIASYIKHQTSYADALRDINESSVHRGQLENDLRRQFYTEYLKMLHYAQVQEMEFYNFFVIRMEIDEILSCFRFLNAGRQGEYFFSLPSYFASRAKFDLFGLAKVSSYKDLLNLLHSTPYYDILKQFDPEAENHTDIIRLENEFNKYYYSHILSVADRFFTGRDRQDIRNIFGTEIDLRNISEVFRLKKYFQVKNDYIRGLLLPFYCKLHREELAAMVDAPDIDGAIQVLNRTYYGKFAGNSSFDTIEKFSQQAIYVFNRRALAFSQSAPVAVVAYLNLKSIEIGNLIRIIEGVRYGLSPAEIEKALTGISA